MQSNSVIVLLVFIAASCIARSIRNWGCCYWE